MNRGRLGWAIHTSRVRCQQTTTAQVAVLNIILILKNNSSINMSRLKCLMESVILNGLFFPTSLAKVNFPGLLVLQKWALWRTKFVHMQTHSASMYAHRKKVVWIKLNSHLHRYDLKVHVWLKKLVLRKKRAKRFRPSNLQVPNKIKELLIFYFYFDALSTTHATSLGQKSWHSIALPCLDVANLWESWLFASVSSLVHSHHLKFNELCFSIKYFSTFLRFLLHVSSLIRVLRAGFVNVVHV